MIVIADYLQKGINLLAPGNEKYLSRVLNDLNGFRVPDSPVTLKGPR